MDLVSFGGLAAIGLLGGFISGFLGLGGGVIIIPLLFYGVGLPMSLATGTSVVQAFFGTLSGVVVHRRNHAVNLKLGLVLGFSGVVGALIGSVGSAFLSGDTLLLVYLMLLMLSITLLLFASRGATSGSGKVNLWLAFPIGLGVGALAGMLGVGGGFLTIPLMISVMRVPTRVAVGTSLFVILMTTAAGATGKVATGQFDPQIAAAVVTGAILGAQLGARASSRVSPRVIRLSLLLLLAGIAIRTGIHLLGL